MTPLDELPLGDYVEPGIPPDKLEEAHRNARIRWIVGACLGIALLIVGVFNAVQYQTGQTRAIKRGQTITAIADLQRQNLCLSGINASAFSAIADALAAPPAPDPKRIDATNLLSDISKQLHDAQHTCELTPSTKG